jgi:hypothetical protein
MVKAEPTIDDDKKPPNFWKSRKKPQKKSNKKFASKAQKNLKVKPKKVVKKP